MDYASSGVNIDAGNHAVDLIKSLVKKTYSPQVQNQLGGFAAYYELPSGYQQPVLVSCTDGVGTKVKLALEHNAIDRIGIDLVAMCVNDLICCGAKPLFFLDYIACNTLVPEDARRLLEGMVEGCLQAECSLVGGEMAEMGDLYTKGDFDLAGFSVGVVEKSKLLDGKAIKPGHHVYALPSSGCHSNGYSLVRKVLKEGTWSKAPNIETYLTPTRIYVKDVANLIARYPLSGLAHITGGGLAENAIRTLPEQTQMIIEKTKIRTPQLFNDLQKAGHISEKEMERVFNLGVGMVVVSEADIPESEGLYRIGKIESGVGKSVQLV